MSGILGSGVYSSHDSAATLAALRDMAPGTILLFQDGLGLAAQVRAEHPDALIFGRLYCDDWSTWQLERLADVCLAHPANAYLNGWQSENEPDVEDYESAQRVARRDKAFAEKMLAGNRWALVGNFAVFHPENVLHLDYWLPAFALPNTICNYHGYKFQGSPLIDTALRYRQWNLPAGTRTASMEYSEEPGGYRKLGITEDQFIADYIAIAAEWRKDGLIGSAVFCIGDSGGWQNFDILGSGIPKRLGDDNRAHPWPAQIAPYPKEAIPMPNAHTIYDEWSRLHGGGFNPASSIGKASQLQGDWGIPESVELDKDEFVIQHYAMGIAICAKANYPDVAFCVTEAELAAYIRKYRPNP